MLNITNYQGKAHQIHNEVITLNLLEWLSPKRQEITSVGEDVDKRETLCTARGKLVNW